MWKSLDKVTEQNRGMALKWQYNKAKHTHRGVLKQICMYLSTATKQSQWLLKEAFLSSRRQQTNMGYGYQHCPKLINTPKILYKENEESKGEKGSYQQIRFHINFSQHIQINTHVEMLRGMNRLNTARDFCTYVKKLIPPLDRCYFNFRLNH